MGRNYNKIFSKKENENMSETQEEKAIQNNEEQGNETQEENVIQNNEEQGNETQPPTEPKTASVKCALNLREDPDMAGGVLCVLQKHDILQVEEVGDMWAHVYTSTGLEGYVVKEYIDVKED